MTISSTLRTVPLFSKLRDSDIELLAGMIKQRDYPKNRVILFSYDPCDALYIVLYGQVKVMLIAEDGREVVLSLVDGGDFFGESALMDDEPYSASAIAVADSRLLILHRDDFRRCITDMPGMSFGLLRELCGRLREADHKIGSLMLLDVSGRVSSLLLELAARSGDDDRIRELPTHQVIAQMVGSSRETVSRTISALIAKNFISSSGGGIQILNRQGLDDEAGHMLRRRPRKQGPSEPIRRSGQTTPASTETHP
jgi:CRP-like cAMP-binding protein